MSVFKYKEDRLPIIIFFGYFVLDLVVFVKVDSIPFLILWFFLGIWPKGNICAWNHHHQHCFTFKSTILNRLLEVMYGLQTGIAGFTWVLHHNLGHHLNYLDQKKDESRWMDKNNKKMSRLRYSLEVTATSYYRAFKVGKKHPKVQKQFIMMVTLTGLVLIGLTVLKPVNALIMFWAPMLLSLTLTADATYAHHSGLDTDEPTKASRNIIQSEWYNRLTGNLGYHTAHHIKFGLHWSRLPKLHEKYKADIPAECYGEPFLLFKMLDNLSDLARRIRRRPQVSS